MIKYSIARSNDVHYVVTIRKSDRPGLALRMDGADAVRAWVAVMAVPMSLNQQAIAEIWQWAEKTYPLGASQ